MATLRQFVSNVRSNNKLISSDNSISDRVIARYGRSAASLLIKRETNLRRLWETDTIFTNIDCLPMKPVPLAECCDYKSAKTISRSKDRLPLIGEGNYNYLVQIVSDIEGASEDYTWIDPKRYLNLLKLKVYPDKTYIWIRDKYLYTTNPDLEVIRIAAYFEEDLPSHFLYPDCDCPNRIPPDPCMNPLDGDFKCPGYLIKQVEDLTNENLMKTYFRHIPQYTSHNKDDQK
jgi:hypothetical protein